MLTSSLTGFARSSTVLTKSIYPFPKRLLECALSFDTGGVTLAQQMRSHLINIWPASETMLPESIESHKWRENAAGSACLSQSNLLLPYL